MNKKGIAAQLREIGKFKLFNPFAKDEDKSAGLELIKKAAELGDGEAMYYLADLMIKGMIEYKSDGRENEALKLMKRSAQKGCTMARAYLNKLCQQRYENDVSYGEKTGPLVNFEGKKIKIKRRGLLTPIDATLEYINGENILTLTMNLMFLYFDEMNNWHQLEEAVEKGVMAWQGEYEVFGGQRLKVNVNITKEQRIFDNVVIAPMTKTFTEKISALNHAIAPKKRRDRLDKTIEDKRSFAISGFKWSVKSRKFIYLQSENGNFDDYEEITHIAKHEIGHALGLGDLYQCADDGLDGVERGKFKELDSYYLGERFYNLVMCDHHAPVSNNDIEMVVLAFSENKIQLFQKGQIKGKISKALGKGN